MLATSQKTKYHSMFNWCLSLLLQLQQLMVSGELPSSKEEAATLASIQLHIDEAWPDSSTYQQSKLPLFHDNLADHSGLLKSTIPEKQENLRRRKELIRTHKAYHITSSRRKGRLVRHLTCMSENEVDSISTVDLSHYLPPELTISRKIRELIKV